jgi:hypothetical protein
MTFSKAFFAKQRLKLRMENGEWRIENGKMRIEK